MKKLITIQEFVKKHKSQEKAAHAIGVSFATVNRWSRPKGHPKHKSPTSQFVIDRLTELGIQTP